MSAKEFREAYWEYSQLRDSIVRSSHHIAQFIQHDCPRHPGVKFDKLKKDYTSLENRSNQFQNELALIFSDATIQRQEQEARISTSVSMLTFLFVPLGLVISLFGTKIGKLANADPKDFAVAASLVPIGVYLIAIYFTNSAWRSAAREKPQEWKARINRKLKRK